MKYGTIVHGRLNRRINRFMAEVFVNGVNEQVHVKNTGRLKELLLPGAEVLLEASDQLSQPGQLVQPGQSGCKPDRKTGRKTRFSLVGVLKDGRLVNVDSLAPNRVAFEALRAGKLAEIGAVTSVRREVVFGDSRFDLYFEQEQSGLVEVSPKGFVEVKGVTLENDGTAMFPDAPTLRGTKHVLGLVNAVREGYAGLILFVVQMGGCSAFAPYREMDPAFADALLYASRQGVRILAYDAEVAEDELTLGVPLPVRLL